MGTYSEQGEGAGRTPANRDPDDERKPLNRPEEEGETILWVLGSLLFGLLGPLYLSARFAGFFSRQPASYRPGGYPWSHPEWSVGITIIKMLALLVWMCLPLRSKRYGTCLAGVFAGIFLVGGGHALACAIANSEYIRNSPELTFDVVLVYLSALAYLANFLLAVLWGSGNRKRLLVGVVLGLLVVVGLPGALELSTSGVPGSSKTEEISPPVESARSYASAMTGLWVENSTGYLCIAPSGEVFVGLENGIIVRYTRDLYHVLGEIRRFHKSGAMNLRISPDGSRLAVVRSDGSLDLIDVRSRRLVKSIAFPQFRVAMGAFSPDSKQLAVYVDSEYDEKTKQWRQPERGNLWFHSARNGRLLRVDKTPPVSGRWQAIDWRGDVIGVVEAYDEEGRGALLWDAAQHVKLRTVAHPEFPCGPLSVALSPDGTKVAVGYAPHDVALWDTANGKHIRDFTGTENWVVCLGFSPDGRLLAAGEGNAAVHVWDVDSGEKLYKLSRDNESDYTYFVGFDATGRRLICGSAGHHVLWYIEPARGK